MSIQPEQRASPKIRIHQDQFLFMDRHPVSIQITAMDQSDWIWISSNASLAMLQTTSDAQLQSSIQSGAGSGAFGDLAVAMPPFGTTGNTRAAVSTLLLGSPLDDTAANMARRLATRFKIQFLVNLDIPTNTDNSMLLAFSERKLIEMLQAIHGGTASTA